MVVRQAKMTSKGQITIPLEVRKALKLREGDTVTFEVDNSGKANLRPEHEEDPFAKWAGALADGKKRSKKRHHQATKRGTWVVTAIDTNVLSVLLFGTVPSEVTDAQNLLKQCHKNGNMCICPIVYAELMATPGANEELIDRFLRDIFVSVDWTLDEAVWRLAAKAYQQYANNRRKQKGDTGPRRILADFIVGAHAALHAGWPLNL